MSETCTISFTLNGVPVSARTAAHDRLLEVVRNEFSRYGAREGCGQGLCGCCTIIIDGRAISGCLFLARSPMVPASRPSGISPATRCSIRPQEAFIEHAAFDSEGFLLQKSGTESAPVS
jgi:aerobic-type carbon monoxide dehydrogenase small subunit (CoxS/CutS family)